MRNILLSPRNLGKDDLNTKLLERIIRSLFPVPPANFDDLLNQLDKAEKDPNRKDH